MPEHVYLTPIPDSTSESIAFISRNIASQVVVSRTLSTFFLFCQSFQPKILAARQKSRPKTLARGKFLTTSSSKFFHHLIASTLLFCFLWLVGVANFLTGALNTAGHTDVCIYSAMQIDKVILIWWTRNARDKPTDDETCYMIWTAHSYIVLGKSKDL